MIKKAFCIFLCIHFLISAAVLPLGDFALLRELPKMYSNYQKIAASDEAGIADFVGDYLLGGKDLLGHNKKDLPEKAGKGTQFQQAIGFAAVITVREFDLTAVFIKEKQLKVLCHLPDELSDFTSELLRPPLVLA